MVLWNTEMTKIIDPRRETPPSVLGVHMSDGSILRARHECGVVCVDVRGLNLDKALRVIRSRSQPLPQQLRDNVDDPGMEAREPLQFLQLTVSTDGLDVI